MVAWSSSGRSVARPWISPLAALFCVLFLQSAIYGDRFFRRTQFIRGDANGDTAVNVGDALVVLNHLFTATAVKPDCMEALNANDDDALDIADGVYVLVYLFGSGAPPPEPTPPNCSVDRSDITLGCDAYDFCPDDTALIVHTLNRITFGPTEALLTEIQTEADLTDYINSQLDNVPANYDQALHEPNVFTRVEELRFGFVEGATQEDHQIEHLKAMLMIDGLASEWQLLHVITQFWNNHFHSQTTALDDQFYSRGNRGGRARRANDSHFDEVDIDNSNTVSAVEWTNYRATYPGLVTWESFGSGEIRDGVMTRAEFNNEVLAYWKYGRGYEQQAVSADMERREYNFYRRGAFGPFRNLLEGCAKSVSMLIYLNGFESTDEQPNENYAREFFELQSLGADRVYTQRDIEELARILTGWSVAWVRRNDFSALDINFHDNPDAHPVPFDLRVNRSSPFNYPTGANWEDELYTWAFVYIAERHDPYSKSLFQQIFGGVDSLGNPVHPEDALYVGNTGRTTPAALAEFDLVMDRVTAMRDNAKFISTKLIQLLVTDELTTLPKTRPMPGDLQELFDSVDTTRDGMITLSEWEQPIPFVMPNGRPLAIFNELDTNGDDVITATNPVEYQEPDLLLDAIEAWQNSNGDMREVIRTILLSDEFLSLDYAYAKVKTPYESTISAMRALEAGARVVRSADWPQIMDDLIRSGMELFDFPDPTGESEFGFDWVHTIGFLERIKFLTRSAFPGGEARFLWAAGLFRNGWGLTDAELTVDYFVELLFGGDILPEQRLLAEDAYLDSTRGREIYTTVAFLLSLPQFQKQ